MTDIDKIKQRAQKIRDAVEYMNSFDNNISNSDEVSERENFILDEAAWLAQLQALMEKKAGA